VQRIGNLLPAVLGKRGLLQQALSANVVYNANNWIKANLKPFSEQSAAATFKDGVLTIKADNSIAAQECNAKLELLKLFLKEEKGFEISDVRIVRS